MMRLTHLHFTRFFTISSAIIALFCPNAAFANNAKATPVEDLALRAGYGDTMANKYLNKPPYDIKQLSQSAEAQEALIASPNNEQEDVVENIFSLLTNTSASNISIANAKSIPIPLMKPPPAATFLSAFATKTDPTKPSKLKSANLDLGSLLTPMMYATVSVPIGPNNKTMDIDQKAFAKNF